MAVYLHGEIDCESESVGDDDDMDFEFESSGDDAKYGSEDDDMNLRDEIPDCAYCSVDDSPYCPRGNEGE